MLNVLMEMFLEKKKKKKNDTVCWVGCNETMILIFLENLQSFVCITFIARDHIYII